MPASTLELNPGPTVPRGFDRALLAAIVLVIISALAARFATNITNLPDVKDEDLMKIPIDDILAEGWSVETAINYQEVKGPTFYWLYAVWGEAFGSGINAMRSLSVTLYVVGAIPMLLLARRAGVKGAMLVAAGGLWALLPYQLSIGQLLFSEPSFIAIAAWMCWAFVWGSDPMGPPSRRVVGPVVVGVLLSLLLHHRPHAVAIAGAIALVSLERDRWRCWPWWLACFLAGVSRLPLWMHWGGLVTSDYQALFTFGFRPDSLTYVLAVVLPWTGCFLLAALTAGLRPRWWMMIVLAGAFGLAMGCFWPPDLDRTVDYFHPTLQVEKHQAAYAGTIATAVKTVCSSPGGLRDIVITVMAALGAASLGAMAALIWRRRADDREGMVHRLAFWSLAAGLPLYATTSGPMYDRYLMVWTFLLPIPWIRLLPRWVLILQGLMLLGMTAYLCAKDLM